MVIGNDTEIGKNSRIFHNAVIMDSCQIGENVLIFPNVTVRENTIIGSNVIIHSGTVIGSDGFGYSPDENGVYNKIPQIEMLLLRMMSKSDRMFQLTVRLSALQLFERESNSITWCKSPIMLKSGKIP